MFRCEISAGHHGGVGVGEAETNSGVIAWLNEQIGPDLAISVLTIGEIARGVARMDEGKRKRALQKWLADELPARFTGRSFRSIVTWPTRTEN